MLNIKNVLIVMLLALMPYQAFAGAVSSGGGVTLPAERVDPDLIVKVAINSRPVIEAHLKWIEYYLANYGESHPDSPYHVYDKLFPLGTDVFVLLGQVNIYFPHGPCLDLDGSEVDGSVNPSEPLQICISIPRLHEKLNMSNYKAETAALILHEISHLMGTDEDEAVAIQKASIESLRSADSYDIFDWGYDLENAVRPVSRAIALTSETIEDGETVQCDALQTMSDQLSQGIYALGNSNQMNLLRARDMQYYGQQRVKFQAIHDYLCSQPGFGDDFDQQYYQRRYSNGFAGQSQVPAGDYWFRTIGGGHAEYGPTPIVTVTLMKIASPSEAAEQMDEIVSDLSRLLNLIYDGEFKTSGY